MRKATELLCRAIKGKALLRTQNFDSGFWGKVSVTLTMPNSTTTNHTSRLALWVDRLSSLYLTLLAFDCYLA